MRQVLKLAGVVIVILISCVWLVLAGVIPDSSADSHRNKENLRTIALALQNYYANYDAYPSPDFAGHSWRIRCLPFMFASPMYEQYRFHEPWNSALNLQIDMVPLPTKKANYKAEPLPKEPQGMPFPLTCVDRLDNHVTSYLMLVGEHAFGKPGGWRQQSEIVDGLEQTIAIAETNRTNIHWLSPEDLNVESMSFVVNDGAASIASDDPRGPWVLFGDGHVFRLSPKVEAAALRALVTIDGGEAVSRDDLLRLGMLLPL